MFRPTCRARAGYPAKGGGATDGLQLVGYERSSPSPVDRMVPELYMLLTDAVEEPHATSTSWDATSFSQLGRLELLTDNRGLLWIARGTTTAPLETVSRGNGPRAPHANRRVRIRRVLAGAG